MARPARKPDPFLDRFRGNFSSMLAWENLDRLWQTVRGQADEIGRASCRERV